MAGGTMTDLFFAGFATTDEFASATTKAARKQSATEEPCGMFLAPKI